MPNNESNIIIYNTPDGKASVALYTRDGKVWLNQQQIAELFGTSKQTISYHILNILKEGELSQNSVVKNYMTTAADGKQYDVIYYSLEMILAIGYRVRGVRGTQFRQWATRHLSEYLVKGATYKKFLLVRQEGSRRVNRNIDHYNLDMIIALGYRVQSEVAVRFRRWATQRLHEYMQKGFTYHHNGLPTQGLEPPPCRRIYRR